MKVLVVKTQSGFLKPAYGSDSDSFSKMPYNEIFEIEFTKRRNIRFHRKFFSLMKLAFENQEAYLTMEKMRKDIIKHAGYSETETDFITGEVTTVAKSISFSNVDEIEFSEIYENCKKVICSWLGIENKMIEEEINQYY